MRAYLPVVGASAVLAVVPLVVAGDRHLLGLAVTMLVFACYAVAFNVLFGGTRQLFLCLGALAGLGGYATALLGNELSVPLAASVALGGLLAAGVGGLFSVVTARRRLGVIFVGIVTLAFSLVFTSVLQAARDLTGGETGVVVEAGLPGGAVGAYYAVLVPLVGFLAVHRLIDRSWLGWAFRALRDDETAAALAGIDPVATKVLAAVVGSAMLGVAGALHAAAEGFVSPSTFAFAHVDVRVLVMLAFGGIGTVLGPVVGAATFTVVDEALRPLGQLRLTVYGLVLIGLFLGFRDGLVPRVTSSAARLRRHRRA